MVVPLPFAPACLGLLGASGCAFLPLRAALAPILCQCLYSVCLRLGWHLYSLHACWLRTHVTRLATQQNGHPSPGYIFEQSRISQGAGFLSVWRRCEAERDAREKALKVEIHIQCQLSGRTARALWRFISVGVAVQYAIFGPGVVILISMQNIGGSSAQIMTSSFQVCSN